MNNVADYLTDCYDDSSHLNPSGAKKVTAYLGNYMMSHYEIPDRRNDPAYAKWHDDLVRYTTYKHKYHKYNQTLKKKIYLIIY